MGRPKIYDDRVKYINDWIADNYDRINLKMKKGLKPMIRGYARYKHISTNELILNAVMMYTEEIYKEAGEDGQAKINALISDCTEEYEKKEEEKFNARLLREKQSKEKKQISKTGT